jgi:hypothetical protein
MRSASVPVSRNRWARYALGAIRIFNGFLGLTLPTLIIGRFDKDPSKNSAAIYAFRMLGIRTILAGLDLFRSGPRGDRAAQTALRIHSSDLATAATLGVTGAVPRQTGLLISAISAVSVVLSLIIRRPVNVESNTEES